MTAAPIRRLKADLTLAGISFLWGSSFVIVQGALKDASTLFFLVLRFSLASLLLLILFRGRYGSPATGVRWKGALWTGVFLFLGYALQTQGLLHTTASKSAFLTGLFIVLVPILSSIVYRTVPAFAEIAGVILAVVGTGLMASTSGGWNWNIGDTFTVACAFAYSAHMVLVAYWSRQMSYELLTLLQVGTVAVLSGATLGWLQPAWVHWTWQLGFAVVFTAVFATALSFALYTWAQRQTTATRAALMFALEPVFAGITAWLWIGEQWTWRMVGGAALILCGVLAVELKPRGSGQHPQG